MRFQRAAIVGGVLLGLLGGVLEAEEPRGSRLAYLDERSPYYPHGQFPRLTTPMWVGEEGVEAVILLTIDDMGGPSFQPRWDVSPAAFERFLVPLVERLNRIDGRAPIAIMTCQTPAGNPTLQQFLQAGMSLDCHTFTHRFPFLRSNEGHGPDEALEFARADYLACLENLFEVPGNRPVAHRMPGCDAQNTVSPRFFTEVFPLRTAAGGFLTCDTSICTWFPSSDKRLPYAWRYDQDGRPRFDKFVENIPQTQNFVNAISNYPFPYVINGVLWELPVTIPCDSHGVHQHRPQNDKTADDWKRAVDICVQKQGLVNILFHTIGYIKNTQVTDVIDYADRTYGQRVKFLNCREIYDRLTRHALGGVPLRNARGGDNGVRLLDVDADGLLDVVIGNSHHQRTRLWQAASQEWREVPLPVQIVAADASGDKSGEESEARRDLGVHFLTSGKDGEAGMAVANQVQRGLWRFGNGKWEEVPASLPEEVDGHPLLTSRGGVDRGVRFRDLDGDGYSDLIVNNDLQNAVFLWQSPTESWQRAPFALPRCGCLVDARGNDQGLRFVDLDGDAAADLVMSNDHLYEVRLFIDAQQGWSDLIRQGEPDDENRLPKIVRNGALNGVWFQAGAMVLQNEHTVANKDFILRIPYGEVLSGVGP